MIRRRSDGKYSSGGSCPKFTKTGKAWTNMGHLKNHLNLVIESGYDRHMCSLSFSIPYDERARAFDLGKSLDVYADCDVIEFKISASEQNAIGIDWMKAELFESYKNNNHWRFA